MARSGSFCAPPGATETTPKGTLMSCEPNTGGRHRWTSAGGGPTERRRLRDRARKAGVKIKRNEPAEDIERRITEALAEQERLANLPPADTGPDIETDTRQRIVDMLAAVGGSEKYLPLGEIHTRLGGMPAEEFTAEVLRLHREKVLVLEEDPLPWRITDADRAVKVHLGGADLTMAILLTAPEPEPED